MTKRQHVETEDERRHRESKRAKMARPRDLLAWFLIGFREEMPDRLHQAGVWRDARHRGDADGYQPVGGSHIGSPRVTEPFRAFVEDDAFGTEVAEYEGHKDIRTHYRTPMRAALARLNGRDMCTRADRQAGHQCEPKPLMARYLFRIAMLDGDVDAAAASFGYDLSTGLIVLESALHRLYERYREEPPTNYRMEDAPAA